MSKQTQGGATLLDPPAEPAVAENPPATPAAPPAVAFRAEYANSVGVSANRSGCRFSAHFVGADPTVGQAVFDVAMAARAERFERARAEAARAWAAADEDGARAVALVGQLRECRRRMQAERDRLAALPQGTPAEAAAAREESDRSRTAGGELCRLIGWEGDLVGQLDLLKSRVRTKLAAVVSQADREVSADALRDREATVAAIAEAIARLFVQLTVADAVSGGGHIGGPPDPAKYLDALGA